MCLLTTSCNYARTPANGECNSIQGEAMQYGTLKNANVTIDGDGLVWLWIVSGREHLGVNLSAALSDPLCDETLKNWAREQDRQDNV